MAKMLKVTQIKSVIGSQPKHKKTIKAIGFHRTYETLVKKDTPQLRGMLHQVRHLVRVEDLEDVSLQDEELEGDA
ncbi:MAG: 50S ribosomal protein L30 [Deltaproteobacteria bacterium]|nr:50S ribosomal protein L30 [Deltaproteobacteria bacterium]